MTSSSRLLFGIQAALIAGCAMICGAPREASACGACFAPPGPPTVVSGHRMVMSISQEQTVLWDQIQYTGNPADFAWVLPVKPGARVEASTAAFFESLEAETASRVIPAPVQCGGGSSGSGCGLVYGVSDSAGEEAPGDNAGDAVDVIHQGTVGPYETVTLSTDQPARSTIGSSSTATTSTTTPSRSSTTTSPKASTSSRSGYNRARASRR